MQRALLQQVSPCKPCADPHINLPEKGTKAKLKLKLNNVHEVFTVRVYLVSCIPPPVFPNAPSSWSLDGENREQVSYMPASTGGVIMPPVPPRSFPPGTLCFCLIFMVPSSSNNRVIFRPAPYFYFHVQGIS